MLNDLFGARCVLVAASLLPDFSKAPRGRLRARTTAPSTPGGDSNSISALGYVRCALNLTAQLNSDGHR
jgi:hypothetical protein